MRWYPSESKNKQSWNNAKRILENLRKGNLRHDPIKKLVDTPFGDVTFQGKIERKLNIHEYGNFSLIIVYELRNNFAGI